MVATLVRAVVRPLSGVDPQVVEEVVPLPEVHWAPRVIALQNFQESLSLRVFKFEDSKRSCGWDMMLAFFLVNFNF